MVGANLLQVVYMAKVMVKQMEPKRSAILTIGSGIRAIPAPGMNLYSATKWFVYQFSKSIATELNLDVLVYEPGAVATKMTKDMDQKGALSPEQAAKYALRDLGK